MSKNEIQALLRDLGFHRKSHETDPDPEEYKDGTVPPPGDGTTVEDLREGSSVWSEYGRMLDPVSVERAIHLRRMNEQKQIDSVEQFLSDLRFRHAQRSRSDL